MTQTQFKLIVFVFMAFIVYNLFRGLYFLVTGKEGGKGTARSLSWRIALSIALFVFLMILKFFGIVEPHALNEKPQATQPVPATEAEPDEGKTLEEIQQQNNDGRIRLKP